MEYKYIGWCKDEKTNSDKVWGVIELQSPTASYRGDGKYVTFCGRRGSKLQTKLWEGSAWDAEEMFHKKRMKGYEEIPEWRLDEVYPEFKTDLEKTAFWATFKI